MKISVIIPVHDLEDRISTCLDSIAAQDLDKSEYEIIVVLDSCTDNTASVIERWAAAHEGVALKLFYTDRKCPGGARNVGIDNAAGEYLLFVDGDDRLMNDSAMTLLCNAIIGHNAVRVMTHGFSDPRGDFSKRLTLWLHFFSRELVGDSRFTDMLLNEDFEFVKRIRNKPSYDEAQINIPLYYYDFDHARMTNRIVNVLKQSHEREKRGLPPLYVSDEFIRDDVDDETRQRILQDRAKRAART